MRYFHFLSFIDSLINNFFQQNQNFDLEINYSAFAVVVVVVVVIIGQTLILKRISSVKKEYYFSVLLIIGF